MHLSLPLDVYPEVRHSVCCRELHIQTSSVPGRVPRDQALCVGHRAPRPPLSAPGRLPRGQALCLTFGNCKLLIIPSLNSQLLIISSLLNYKLLNMPHASIPSLAFKLLIILSSNPELLSALHVRIPSLNFLFLNILHVGVPSLNFFLLNILSLNSVFLNIPRDYFKFKLFVAKPFKLELFVAEYSTRGRSKFEFFVAKHFKFELFVSKYST